MTLFLKACPRCKGDVHQTTDHFGEVKSCLQCGWSHDVEKVQPHPIDDILGAIRNSTYEF